MKATWVQRTDDRRGVILIIVLAMLGLFAAIAVSFTLVATSESVGARNFKRAFSVSGGGSAGGSGPAIGADELYRFGITQILYDTNVTTSALRGHSLLRDMYGGRDADPRHVSKNGPNNHPKGEWLLGNTQTELQTHYQGVYNGTGLFVPRDLAANYFSTAQDTSLNFIAATSPTTANQIEPTEVAYFLSRLRPVNPLDPNAVPGYLGFSASNPLLDPIFPLNFMVFSAAPGALGRSGTPTVGNAATQAPEEYWLGPSGSAVRHYFGYDEDYDAADHNNMFLALERADGQILIPSFHRPYLIRQLEQAGLFTKAHPDSAARTAPAVAASLSDSGTVYSAWLDKDPNPNKDRGRRVILRPRELEYNQRAINNQTTVNQGWQDLKDLDLSGFVGDCPDELDVDTDGDGIKDAIWIDLGKTPIDRSDVGLPGTGRVKPLYAFKVIDLDGKVNINTAGKFLASDPSSPAPVAPQRKELHSSNLGASVAEINPKHLLAIRDSDPTQAPVWNNPEEYKRLLFGNEGTNLGATDTSVRVRGKWAPSSLPDTVLFSTGAENYLNQRPGKRALPDGTKSPLQYASISKESPLDWLGTGRTWEPTTRPGALLRGLSTNGVSLYKSINPIFVNYIGYGLSTWAKPLPIPNDSWPDPLGVGPGMAWNANSAPTDGHSGWTLAKLGTDIDASTKASVQLSTFFSPVSASIVQSMTDEAEEMSFYSADAEDSPITGEQMERLLRYFDIDLSSLDPRLENLLSSNLRSETFPANGAIAEKQEWARREYARRRIRRMLTHSSWDLTHFNASPTNAALASVPEDESRLLTVPPTTDIRHNGRFGFTPAASSPAPALALGTTTYFGNRFPTEVQFGQRYDLNKALFPYDVSSFADLATLTKFFPNGPQASPPLPALTPIDAAQWAAAADLQRSEMAEQLYVLLWLAVRPDVAIPTVGDPYRIALVDVLAQIAVNIVDYLDPDNVMTVMQYHRNLSDGSSWTTEATVIGFELPDLVINEGAAVIHPPEKATDKDKVFVFAELRNPWPTVHDSTGARVDSRTGELIKSGISAHKLRIKDKFDPSPSPTPHEVDFSATDSLNAAAAVNIPGDDGLNQGCFVVGSRDPDASGHPARPSGDVDDETGGGANLNWISGWTAAQNSYTSIDPELAPIPPATVVQSGDMFYYRTRNVGNESITVELRRLRNPWIAESATNPYITIDILELTSTEGVYYSRSKNGATGTALAGRLTYERKQPWVGQGKKNWNPSGAALTDPSPVYTLPAPNPIGAFLGFPPIDYPKQAVLWGSDSAGPVEDTYNFNDPGFLACNGTHTFKTRNSRDLPAYLSFPFLNRPLTTPLELLSLRLYGPHLWSADSEWRLRFTDDYELILNPTSPGAPSINDPPGVYRSRQVPWFDDFRSAANDAAHPLNALGSTTNFGRMKSIPDLGRFFDFVECHSRMRDATVLDAANLRKHRAPGKINLNTITDEEVFRALVDEPEAMPAQGLNLNPPYNTFKIPTRNSNDRLPTGYVFNPFRNLRSGALGNSPNTTAGTTQFDEKGISGDTFGSSVFGGNLQNFNSDWGTIAKQWPGINVDTASSGTGIGRDRTQQVHSEFFRQFLLSRTGQDGVLGTGDDKPFRGFSSSRLSDTMLRRRNFKQLDRPELERLDPTANAFGEAIGLTLSPKFAPGAFVPRLFDPIPDPFSYAGVAARVENLIDNDPSGPFTFPMVTSLPNGSVASQSGQAVHHWMLEARRNKILGKIAGNTTTRSHVFAVWMTIGFFDVDNETVTPELIGTEAGLATGNVQRRRCFFIVDRSLANHYDGPDPSLNGPALNDIEMLVLPGKVRFIE